MTEIIQIKYRKNSKFKIKTRNLTKKLFKNWRKS